MEKAKAAIQKKHFRIQDASIKKVRSDHRSRSRGDARNRDRCRRRMLLAIAVL
jgi:hypothetical protein